MEIADQFMLVGIYPELLQPTRKRPIEWTKAKGVCACLHSCGRLDPFVPEWVDIGVDRLNALEVKAGIEPACLKDTYGDRVVLSEFGGRSHVVYVME